MKPGDRVRITRYHGINKVLMGMLVDNSGLATVSEADPIKVGEDGNYHTDYIIYCEELPGIPFAPGEYQKVN